MQLEFDKVKALLAEKCRTDYAKQKANGLRIHTKKEFIERELKQSHEYKQRMQNGIYFPKRSGIKSNQRIKAALY